MSTGAEDIALERLRQQVDEGYLEENDHGRARELAHAGKRYAQDAEFMIRSGYKENRDGKPDEEDMHFGTIKDWPWADEYYKPGTDPIRTLVKAGALIAAAIDALKAEEADPTETLDIPDKFLAALSEATGLPVSRIHFNRHPLDMD